MPNWRNTNWKSATNWSASESWLASQSRQVGQSPQQWDRTHHDRAWWRSHYNRFAVFGGGYYYWNTGYWYPAYGYDPYFSTYSYDAPIYRL